MNLNQEKRIITKGDIFSKVSSLDIYRNYCPKFEINAKMHSPFRNDKNPSFGFFKGRSGELMFKDLATGEKGDCIDFTMKLFSLSYFDALSKIATDFHLKSDEFFYREFDKPLTPNKIYSVEENENLMSSLSKPEVSIRTRQWVKDDALFWRLRGVDYNILTYYRVVPISHIFINENVIKADRLAYAFIEIKDNEETYKIYQPMNTSGMKWFSSHSADVWQGWTQLPARGPELIVTKSLKDVMAIANVLRIPAVAMQSETLLPTEKIVSELETRFEEIYILYDNDFDKEVNIGREMGAKVKACFKKAIQIELPDEWNSKDFSDLVYNKVQESNGDYKEGYSKAHHLFKSNLILPF